MLGLVSSVVFALGLDAAHFPTLQAFIEFGL